MKDFDYDIFVSYAHIDNESIVEGESGWVSDFHSILEKRLSMFLGEKPRIWRDPSLRGNEYFDEIISRGYLGTALFLSILSPRYVKSDYCQKELNEFYNQSIANGLISVQGKSRLFRVIKTPFPQDENPPPLKRLLGYEFYERDDQTKRIREYRVNSSIYRERFLLLLDDLAQEIVETLHIIKQGGSQDAVDRAVAKSITASSPAAGQQAEAEAEQGISVYLAPTSFDLKNEYESIKRELVERGYQVFPDVVLPLEYNELKPMLEEYLGKSKFSIHPIGRNYGIVPENSEKSVISLQNEIAASVSKETGLRRIIWIPPDVEFSDERQMEFIRQLKTDPGALHNASLLSNSIDQLKCDIVSNLELLLKESGKDPEPEVETDIGPMWVYLMYGESDAENVADLEEFLWNENFEVKVPLFDDDADEEEAREEHDENLKICDAFVFYYGNNREKWLRKCLNDLKKIYGFGREKKILSKLVIIGSPVTDKKKRFRTNEATVLKIETGGLESVFPAILTQLKEAEKKR